MLRAVRRLIPFSLSIALFAQQPPAGTLVGRWRSAEASPAGVSAVFEFRADRQLDSYSAVVSEQTYRVVGTDTILLQSKGGREEKQELEWDSPDRARIEDEAAGKSIDLTRLGKSADSRHPLTGEWRTVREWNGRKYPARAVFSADGKALWIIELRVEHGSYSAEDRKLKLEIPNRPLVEGAFTLAGNRMTLPNPQGGQSAFERF